jgi:hypothetical protein
MEKDKLIMFHVGNKKKTMAISRHYTECDDIEIVS